METDEPGTIYRSRNAGPWMTRRDWLIATAIAFPGSLFLLLVGAVKLLG
ncbi:MAG: hypothetical protein ABW046_20505 [Actinoplanes sp.]